MLKQLITVMVQSMVSGPDGNKLRPGQVVELEDSEYVRILVKSGTVTLIDPPSLDSEYLEKAGYELRDGYVPEVFLVRKPKKEKPNENGTS